MNPPKGGFLLEIRMAKAKGNSYVGSGGSRSNSFGRVGSLGYGALRNTISRRDAANLARRKSIGGKGG
ncbi:hypothetical protein [Neisseria lactamica]|uniref:hypothetical protein n=2 Tax=Neisseria TaxID=482 RepID=UPI001863F14B|nr:hypothetical protein [Neisseria lactamica]